MGPFRSLGGLVRRSPARRSARRRSDRRRPRGRPFLEALEGRYMPSTVTNLDDDGAGSLRQAIRDTPKGGTVDFQPGLAGFRMQAPRRGQARRPGVGTIRCAVERGHAFLSQCGRIARRLDRLRKRFLGWVQLAASLIFLRAEAHGFYRPRTLRH